MGWVVDGEGFDGGFGFCFYVVLFEIGRCDLKYLLFGWILWLFFVVLCFLFLIWFGWYLVI